MSSFSRSFDGRSASADRRRPALGAIDTNVMVSPGPAAKHQQRPLITRSLSARSLRGAERQGTPRAAGATLAIPAETPAPVEAQASPYQDEAEAAANTFGAFLEANGQVDLKSLVASLVPDTEKVREVFKSAPTAKKLITSPANMAKSNDCIKSLKAVLKDIMLQSKALIEASTNAEDSVNKRLRANQVEIAHQQEQHNEDRTRWEREAQANKEVFDQALAECRREQAELSAAADRREAELTHVLEKKEKDIGEKKALIEAQSNQLACIQEELASCREVLKAKTELAEGNAKERDLVQARYETLREQHGASENQKMEAIAELKVMVSNLTSEVESTKLEVRAKELNETDQQAQILALRKQLLEEERVRREQHNAIQEMKGNIRVIGRTRPAFNEGTIAAVRVSEGTGKMSVFHVGETYNFEFDNVFGCESTQQRLFGEVEGLVQSALDGYKVCIFAYGQTGSGKTFTMQGSRGVDTEGIIPRALMQIFERTEALKAKGWTWTLEASFLEVYQEQIRDLLLEGAAAESQPVHAILQDDEKGTAVSNLTVVNVDCKAQIQRLMAKAARHRSVGETDMNAVSSRSHAVFALYLKGVNAELDTELTGALHLVDLAGSERVSKSNATGARLKETCSINKSLSCLTDVFAAKQEEASGGRSHIPFRNSKLTHLMEPCLSGHGKTLMVVNVAPEESYAHESLCSLRFASQVGLCNTGGKPQRNAKTLSETASTSRAGTRPSTPTSRVAAPTVASSARTVQGRSTNPFGI